MREATADRPTDGQQPLLPAVPVDNGGTSTDAVPRPSTASRSLTGSQDKNKWGAAPRVPVGPQRHSSAAVDGASRADRPWCNETIDVVVGKSLPPEP